MLTTKPTFSCACYNTIYEEKSYRPRKLMSNACFAGINIDSIPAVEDYDIYIRSSILQGCNNGCFLTREQIETYLKEIFSICPNCYFELEDFEAASQELSCLTQCAYRIKAHVSGHRRQHIFLLSLIRYLYEYPYCAILYRAMQLRELEEYNKENYLNLMYLVSRSAADIGTINSGHCVFMWSSWSKKGSILRSLDSWKEAFCSLKPELCFTDQMAKSFPPETFRNVEQHRRTERMFSSPSDPSTWENDPLSEKALQVLHSNYDLLKQISYGD